MNGIVLVAVTVVVLVVGPLTTSLVVTNHRYPHWGDGG